MSNSPLATVTMISPNKTSPRNHAIDRITIHCFVGQVTARRGCEVFQPRKKKASANYVVGKDGDIGLCVDEADRSWCSSSASNDNRAVTIETASATADPYPVTDAAYNALLDLCEDICRRNGKRRLTWIPDKKTALAYKPAPDEMLMTVHRWFAAKACPGQYLLDRHPAIAAEVTRRLSAVQQTQPFQPYRVRVSISNLNIRDGPGTNYARRSYIPAGVYTIVEERAGKGSKAGWGRLKSGVGWISLDYVKRE